LGVACLFDEHSPGSGVLHSNTQRTPTASLGAFADPAPVTLAEAFLFDFMPIGSRASPRSCALSGVRVSNKHDIKLQVCEGKKNYSNKPKNYSHSFKNYGHKLKKLEMWNF
jgi:hypothetical protein